MRRLFGFLANKWVIGIIGLIALSLLVWYGANYIKFGEDNATLPYSIRIAIIVIVWAFWLTWNISRWFFERKQNEQLLTDIEKEEEKAAVNPDEERSREELSVISDRFRDAMATLKKSRFKSSKGSVSLYQLPWYIIIGPPGSGKSTALVNSGLEFPLARNHGKEALGGVGGTRSCDWWFTNEAVLIDTAGRFTTQDSHRVIDNSSWNAFLGLLKRYRRRRPINGAFIAISLQDLMVQTAEQRMFQAKTIRTRINELQVELGIRFPVYLIFTKCDLVAGFSEFFDNFSQAEREQVWGISFPAERDPTIGAPIENFAVEFDQLIERLNQRLLWRVHNERDVQKRSLLQGFPARMETLSEILDDFVKQTFSPNRYDKVPMVRGVYFTSATQEGSPIDRMMAAVSANFGLQREMGKQQVNRGKSFFLHRLLLDVVFPESELVGVNQSLERGMLWLRRGAYACLALILAGAALLWTGSVTRNKMFMSDVQAHIEEFRSARDFLPRGNRDFSKTLEVLTPLRAASTVYDQEEHPWLSNIGLYDGSVDTAADKLYAAQLDELFLPTMKSSLEYQLKQLDGSDEALLDTLKIYLMMFDGERRNIEEIKQFMRQQWEFEYPEETEKQQALAEHMEKMFSKPLPSNIQLDEKVVERSRRQLRKVPVAKRLYNRVKSSDLFYERIDLYTEVGGDIEQIFGLSDDNPVFSMPAMYTKPGYKSMDFTAKSPLIEQYDQDRWIFGPDVESEDFSEAERVRVVKDLKRAYLTDYADTWKQFLHTFKIAPFRSASNGLDMLEKLSDPIYSPLLAVADITAKNTALTPKPKAKLSANGVPLPVSSTARRLGSAAAGAVRDKMGDKFQPTVVDIRFEELQRIAASENNRPARIHEYLTSIQGVREFLIEINNAPDSNQAAFEAAKGRFSGGGGDAIKQLRVKAGAAPDPVNKWLNDIADNTWALVTAKAKLHVDQVWKEQVYSVYQRTLDGKYPMVAGRSSEVPAMEFNAFFGPAGVEKTFVETYIKPFVDTRTWTLKSMEGQSLGVSEASLQQMRRAANIRSAYYRLGEVASMKFRAEPTKLDSGVRLFTLELGSAKLSYSHGPRTPKAITWISGEHNRARVIFEDLNETIHRKHFEGDWAWLRLLDASKIASTGNSNVRLVTFKENGRSATYKLTASNSINPFDKGLLRNYRCLEAL